MKNTEFRQRMLALICLLMIGVGTAWSQMNVKGKVISPSGEAIIGANVLEKGTSNGVITDLDGNFSLKVENGAILVFSYIGYTPQELKAKASMEVVLEEDTELLDEVVVVGYGVQKKSSVTGSISKVDEKELSNRTITSAAQALSGKTSGVQILSTSSAPGETPVVRVRGFSSNYSSDPLYIVDGLKMSSIANIDANDIESMEVLKDAASAAIYGAEAGNGVVLITTKKAQVGKAKISYDFQYSIQSLCRMPEVLNAKEYINYYKEGGFITDEKLSNYYDGVTDTNWADIAFENSLMSKHTLSFEQASEKSSILVSLNYLNNNGIVVGDKDTFKRYNLTFNAEMKPKSWLTLGVNSNIAYYKHKSISANNGGVGGGIMTSVLELDPLTPVYYDNNNLPDFITNMVDGGYNLLQASNGNYYGISQFYQSAQINPLELRDINTSERSGKNIRANLYANLQPIKGLTITSRLGVNFLDSYSRTYSKEYYCSAWAENSNPTVSQSSPQTEYWQWENFANYTKKLGQHTLGVMIGTSYSEQIAKTLTTSINDILKDEDSYAWIDFASGNATKTVGGIELTTRKFSYFGRLNYDFDNRYIAELSLRADAADSSVLPEAQRWGYFPAASLGWVVSNEKFFSLIDLVSYMKIRGSWGQNGSIANLSNYTYATSITSNAKYPFGDGSYSTGSYPTALGNNKLKWETSEQLDFGVDMRFFKDRLSLSLDYYIKKTKDLLVYGSTPSLTAGNTPSPINAGNVENKGLEVDLSWKDNIKDFSYSVSANISTLKNKVTYLDPTIHRLSGTSGPLVGTGVGTYFEVGYPVWYMRGYHVEGIDPVTGNPVFKDLNHDNAIDANDVDMIGSGIPDINYGVTVNLAYKGFDLVIFGSGAAGNDIWYSATYNNVTGANTLKYFYDNRWTTSNVNAKCARPLCNDTDKYYASDAYVFDGSYFKIKQIQLGYTIPKMLTKKWGFENIRAYISLDDFFTFTSYPGLDPEAASLSSSNGIGMDTGYYPQSKKVVFGFNVTF